MKEISFKYMTKQKLAWQPLELTPEEYFELDAGEVYDIYCSSRYTHLHQYLDISLDQLLFIHLLVNIQKERKEFKQTFWNDGKNFVIEVKDKFSKELIINSLINKSKDEEEIIRITYGRNQLYPVYHGFIKDGPNQTAVEKAIDVRLHVDLCKKEGLLYP
jgi:hypothetical protein